MRFLCGTAAILHPHVSLLMMFQSHRDESPSVAVRFRIDGGTGTSIYKTANVDGIKLPMSTAMEAVF
ncbi:hypothetical protein ACOSQ2_027742 [Xanthoceras sorbifolium]